jgi:hydroxyacylglutathione hydrolase
VEGVALGPFETNCYVVRPEPARAGDPCWIVDAGFEPGDLIAMVREHGLRPELLILTHAHGDHIAGVRDVLAAWPKPPVPILIHEAEREWLADPSLNLSLAIGMPVTTPGPDRVLREGDVLALGDSEWKVLHTPGHSPGGITLYNAADGVALVGDALFAGSVGRTDFPGSDPRTLARSIREKLYTLPDETVVYPGHGPETTIGVEKRTNPFVRG